jgi:hypothetical protein
MMKPTLCVWSVAAGLPCFLLKSLVTGWTSCHLGVAIPFSSVSSPPTGLTHSLLHPHPTPTPLPNRVTEHSATAMQLQGKCWLGLGSTVLLTHRLGQLMHCVHLFFFEKEVEISDFWIKVMQADSLVYYSTKSNKRKTLMFYKSPYGGPRAQSRPAYPQHTSYLHALQVSPSASAIPAIYVATTLDNLRMSINTRSQPNLRYVHVHRKPRRSTSWPL